MALFKFNKKKSPSDNVRLVIPARQVMVGKSK